MYIWLIPVHLHHLTYPLILYSYSHTCMSLCFLSVQHILPPAAVVWESSLCMHPSTYLTSSCLLIVFPCCVFVRSLLPYAASQFNGSLPAICMNRPFTISPFLLPSLPHYSQLAYTHSFPFSLPSARRVVSNIFSSSPHFPVPQHTWRLTSPIITVYNPFYLSSQSSSGLIIALCWGSLHLTSIVHSRTSAIYITFLPLLLPLPPFPPSSLPSPLLPLSLPPSVSPSPPSVSLSSVQVKCWRPMCLVVSSWRVSWVVCRSASLVWMTSWWWTNTPSHPHQRQLLLNNNWQRGTDAGVNLLT